MTRDDIFTVVRRNVLAVLNDLDEADVQPQVTMRALGANSLDRIDIVVGAADELGIELSARDMTDVAGIAGLVDAFYAARLSG
jgi:polyketide biosynthesis acyl carrier protein